METTDYLNGVCPDCDLRNRHEIAQDYYANFLNRIDSMFKWNGLPESIPEYILERYLKTIGWCGIGKAPDTAKEHAGELVCFFGGLGETPNLYYQPTAIIMANPVLGSKTYKIGEDCVWAKNDSLHRGVSHLLSRNAHLLASNDISINIAQVTSRMPFAITAETENEYESAKLFIKQAEEGKIGIIKSSAFNNGVKPSTLTSGDSGNYLKALVELHQYLKAQWYNDLGIGAQFNMKRERVNTAETEQNSPSLLPLVHEMLKFRKLICADVKKLFPDQNWTVELDSAWELELKSQEQAVEQEPESNRLDEEESDEV